MTIFHEAWWLDAVAPGNWSDIAQSADVDRWPFVLRPGPGPIKRVQGPPLTPRLGPLIGSVSAETDLSRWSQRLREMAAALPPSTIFRQAFHPGISYWLPLEWDGFQQTQYFSMVIRDTSDLELVRRQYSKGTRSDRKKAAHHVELRVDQPIAELYAALTETLSRSGRAAPYPLETLERAFAASVARGRGRHISAHSQGRYIAGGFFVWDQARMYYLVGGSRAVSRGTGAPTLIIDSAIALASQKSLEFDCEGSRIPSIERFFRSFGAKPEGYSLVSKSSRWVRALESMKQ